MAIPRQDCVPHAPSAAAGGRTGGSTILIRNPGHRRQAALVLELEILARGRDGDRALELVGGPARPVDVGEEGLARVGGGRDRGFDDVGVLAGDVELRRERDVGRRLAAHAQAGLERGVMDRLVAEVLQTELDLPATVRQHVELLDARVRWIDRVGRRAARGDGQQGGGDNPMRLAGHGTRRPSATPYISQKPRGRQTSPPPRAIPRYAACCRTTVYCGGLRSRKPRAWQWFITCTPWARCSSRIESRSSTIRVQCTLGR